MEIIFKHRKVYFLFNFHGSCHDSTIAWELYSWNLSHRVIGIPSCELLVSQTRSVGFASTAVGKQRSPNIHQLCFLQPRCHSALLPVAIIAEIESNTTHIIALRRIWLRSSLRMVVHRPYSWIHINLHVKKCAATIIITKDPKFIFFRPHFCRCMCSQDPIFIVYPNGSTVTETRSVTCDVVTVSSLNCREQVLLTITYRTYTMN